MSGLSYHEAWSFLDRLQFFKIKLGLDSMNMFLDSLGHPQNEFPCIHIGGTNGKGSVGATILAVLRESARRVGFYTSPHLSSVRERFRINDRYISEREFTAQAEKIIRILDGRQITYFEFTTALALLWFAEMRVDLAILEVGLGGRLDATNVVTPLVSVITNVSMDHEQYLGSTITEVAREKAGIIKPGIPLVTGEREAEPLAVLTAAAREKQCPAYLLGRDFTGRRDPGSRDKWTYTGIGSDFAGHLAGLPLAMKGSYQVDNASVALAALEVMAPRFPLREAHIRRGLRKVVWPGRLEEFGIDSEGRVIRDAAESNMHCPRFLLDGAHNPGGAHALRQSLENDFTFTGLILIWSSMADKDMSRTLLAVAPLADRIIFTRPESERSAQPGSLLQLLPENLRDRACCAPNVKEAIRQAFNSFRPGNLICVAGSLYLVGAARRILCGELVREP
jgi:dihydrofolate synthase/folylpolyglutamate synthase